MPPYFVKLLFPLPHFVKLSEFDKVVQPSLNLRSTFVTYSAVPARRLSFAYPSLILRLLCATHFVKLSEFDKVVQPSSHTRLCQLVDYPSLILRLSFAYPSLKIRPRWRKLAACAQFKIHNSKFIILPHSPLIFPLSSPYHSFKIDNKISKKN